MKIILGIIFVSVFSLIMPINQIHAEEPIPDWVRHVTGLWAKGKISDSEFFDLLENLLDTGVIPTEINPSNNFESNYNYQGIFKKPSWNENELVIISWQVPEDIKKGSASTQITIIQPDDKLHQFTVYGNILHFELNGKSPTGIYEIEGKHGGQSFTIPSFHVVETLPEYELPLWIKSSAKWWSEEQIPDSQFRRALHYLISNDIVQMNEQLEKRIHEKVEQESKLSYLVLPQDEINNLISNSFWKLIKTEKGSSHNKDGVVDSISLVLKDTTRLYEPIYYKQKIPSIIIEVYEFDDKTNAKKFWNPGDKKDKSIFELMKIKGTSESTGDCFFNNNDVGAISACMYDNLIVQVVIYDESNTHYSYKNEISNLNEEPTIKILNNILEIIHKNKGISSEVSIQDILVNEPSKDFPTEKITQLTNIENSNVFAKKSTDPEKSLKSGIENFSCQRDEFGLITVSGLYVNDGISHNQVTLTISLVDHSGNLIGEDSGGIYDLENFESREFLVYTKWRGDFSHCEIDVDINDNKILN